MKPPNGKFCNLQEFKILKSPYLPKTPFKMSNMKDFDSSDRIFSQHKKYSLVLSIRKSNEMVQKHCCAFKCIDASYGAQRAKIAEKVHKPPLEINVINFECNGFNAFI